MNNRIPPPIVTLICGLTIYYSKSFFNQFLNFSNNGISLFLLILGLIVFISAVISFRKQKTTVNPLKPKQASSLVTSGIFRFSRNPMYIGLLLVLLGISTILNPIGGFFLIPLFILYLNFFQIIPEESAMVDLFKDEFLDYKKNVRRWI